MKRKQESVESDRHVYVWGKRISKKKTSAKASKPDLVHP